MKVKEWNKYTVETFKRCRSDYVPSDETDFRAKKIAGDEGTLCNGKRVSPPADPGTLSAYASDNGATKYAKQNLMGLKGEKDGPTILVGDLDVPLSVTDRQISPTTNRI